MENINEVARIQQVKYHRVRYTERTKDEVTLTDIAKVHFCEVRKEGKRRKWDGEGAEQAILPPSR